ncbi:beta-lactamase-like protein [Glomus cerebriforme]|uniref:ribonuclease Z n=1 Tax=Glomus cerebriforme TaxID=658196 RepID=A0A397T752_9GLOM|nr:beta-lactamase-like protein [Glomus cerebriforme]
MKSYIQILGTGTVDVNPSILVHYDGQRGCQRYLFNCGEGTQRICLQNKLKLAKTRNIFLTRVNWECVGGLPGMLLTLADAGTKEIKIFGGENLTHFLTATRGFVMRSTMSVETHEFKEDGMGFNDDNLTILPVFLYPEGLKNIGTSSSFTENLETGTKRTRDSALEEIDSDSTLKYKKEILSLMFNQSQRSDDPKSSNKKRFKIDEDIDAALSIPDEPQDNQTTGSSSGRKSSSSRGNNKDSLRDRRRELFPKRLPKSQPSYTSVAYICKGPDYKGKFDPLAAKALGLKPGRQYSELAKGNSVTAPNGNIIHPHQVLGPSRPGLIFIILDVPSTSYISSLCESPEFVTYQANNGDLQPRIIVHIIGNGVLEDKRYQEWMTKFGPETEHIIANEQYCPQRIIFYNSALSQLKLSKIDEKHFRIPYYSNEPIKQLKSLVNIPKKTSFAVPMMIYQTEPSFKLDNSQLGPVFDHNNPNSEAVNLLESLSDYLKVVEQVKQDVARSHSETKKNKKIPGKDVIVTTLGTGSTLPSKYRNVSSTLITIPNNGFILLDVGEGTLGSMSRHFGPYDEPHGDDQISLESCISDLKCIFVSHMHADHHLGIIRVLRKWNEIHKSVDDATISVFGPTKLWKWVEEYSDVEDFGLSKIKFIDNKDLLFWKQQKGNITGLDSLQDLKSSTGINKVETVAVIHCPNSFGISIEHFDGWKIVYSGDTRPCDDLVRAGKDATLLIHEATFENDLMEEALNKFHSTTEEAVSVGERMNAHTILLTHFSQRYPKVPVFTDDHGKVGISFDLMQVRIGELYKLSKFVKALKVLYTDEGEEANEEVDND